MFNLWRIGQISDLAPLNVFVVFRHAKLQHFNFALLIQLGLQVTGSNNLRISTLVNEVCSGRERT